MGNDGVARVAVLAGSEPDGLIVVGVDGCGDGAVDGFAIGLEPLAYLVEALDASVLDETLRRGTHTEQEAAALGDNLGKDGEDAIDRLVLGMVVPAPVLRERDATLPRSEYLMVGDGLLGRLIVLELASAGAIDYDDARLETAGIGDDAW